MGGVYGRCTAGLRQKGHNQRCTNGVPTVYSRCTAGCTTGLYGGVRQCTAGQSGSVRRCTAGQSGSVRQVCTVGVRQVYRGLYGRSVRRCTAGLYGMVYGRVQTRVVGWSLINIRYIRRLVSGWCCLAVYGSPGLGRPGITVYTASQQPLRHSLRRRRGHRVLVSCVSVLSLVSGTPAVQYLT